MVDYQLHVSAGSYAVSSGRATLSVHAPMPDDHPMLLVVGQIASQWAHIEHVLDMIIWRLASVEPRKGACITAQLNGPYARFRAILSLANVMGLDRKLIKRIHTLSNEVQGKAEKRHRVVHDPWYSEMNTKSPAQFKSVPFGRYNFGLEASEAQNLDQAIKEGKEAFIQVTELHNAVVNILAASTGRPQQAPL